MRASSALKADAGMSTSSRSAWSALRTRVRKSAIGSVIVMVGALLPARLGEAGDLTLVGDLAQADSAEAELAQVRARAAAAPAAVVIPHLELRRAALAHHL